MAAMEVLMLLEGRALERVYDEFKKKADETDGDGLTLDEFITACLKNIESTDATRVELVDQLTELFAAIDVNGDEQLEWSEFIGFIAEAGVMSSVKKLPPRPFRYAFDAMFVDRCSRPDCKQILKLQRSSGRRGCIYALEDEISEIRIYDQICSAQIGSINVDPNHRAGQPPLFAIDMELIAEHRLVAVMLSSYTIGLWHTAGQQSCHGMLPRRGAHPSCMCWNADSNRLFVGCKDGRVQVFDVESRKLVAEIRAHADVVTSILSVYTGSTGSIVTHGLDKKVQLWDATLGSTRPQPIVGTKQILNCLTWMPKNAKLLAATHGGGGEIIAWDLAITGVAFQLVGHQSDVVAMSPVHNDSRLERLVSVDSTCMFRVWELYESATGEIPCLTVFSPPAVSVQQPNCMLVLSFRDESNSGGQQAIGDGRAMGGASGSRSDSERQAAAVTRSLKRKDENPPALLGVADEHTIVLAGMRMQLYRHTFFVPGSIVNVAVHNPVSHAFVTCVGTELSVWDDHNGRKTLELPKVFPTDATAICFDDRKRKLIIGKADGVITAYNCLNGAEMKEVSVPHAAEVTSLVYHVKDRNLVSTSRDGSIMVHDEEPQESIETLRYVQNAHDGECTCGAVSEELAYIASGGADGVVRVWDYESLELIVELVHEISNRTSIDSHNIDPKAAVAPPVRGGSVRMHSSAGAMATPAVLPGVRGRVGPSILSLKLSGARPLLVSSDAAGTIRLWGLQAAPVSREFTHIAAFSHTFPQARSVLDTSPPSGRASLRAIRAAVAMSKPSHLHQSGQISQAAARQLAALRKKRRPAGVRLPVEDEASRWWEGELQRNSYISRVIDFLLERSKRAGLLAPQSKADKQREQRIQAAVATASDRGLTPEQAAAEAEKMSGVDGDDKASVAALYAIANASLIRDEMQRLTAAQKNPRMRQVVEATAEAAHLIGLEFDLEALDMLAQATVGQNSSTETYKDCRAKQSSLSGVGVRQLSGPRSVSAALCLYDDAGNVTVYNIESLLEESLSQKYLFQIPDDSFSYNRGSYEAMRTVRLSGRPYPRQHIGLVTRRSTGHTVRSSCDAKSVHLQPVRQFQAHAESMRTGQLLRVSGQYCVATGGMDGRVRVWSVGGAILGQLCTPQWEAQLWDSSSKASPPTWLFPSELEAERERARQEAEKLARRVISESGQQAAEDLDTVDKGLHQYQSSTFLTGVGLDQDPSAPAASSTADAPGSLRSKSQASVASVLGMTSSSRTELMFAGSSPLRLKHDRNALGRSTEPPVGLLAQARRSNGENEVDEGELVPLEVIQNLDQQRVVEDLATELDGGNRRKPSRREMRRKSAYSGAASVRSHGGKTASWTEQLLPQMSAVARAKYELSVRERVKALYKHAARDRLSGMGVTMTSMEQKHERAVQAVATVSPFLSSRLPVLTERKIDSEESRGAASSRRMVGSPIANSRKSIARQPTTPGQEVRRSARTGVMLSQRMRQKDSMPGVHQLKSDATNDRAKAGKRVDSVVASKLEQSMLALSAAKGSAIAAVGQVPHSRYRRASTAMDRAKLESLLHSQAAPSEAAPQSGKGEQPGTGKGEQPGTLEPTRKVGSTHPGLLPPLENDQKSNGSDDEERDAYLLKAYRAAGIKPPKPRRSKVSKTDKVKWSGSPRSGAGGAGDGSDGGEDIKVPTRFGPYSALEVIRMRRLFESIDKDASGSVELHELQGAPEWKQLFSDEEIRQLFEAMDIDGSGDVTLFEVFRAAFPVATASDIRLMIRTTRLQRTVNIQPVKKVKRELSAGQKAEIEAVFRAFDIHGKGEVTVGNIKQVMEQYRGLLSDVFGIKEITDVLAAYDEDGNMAFDVDEFTVMMKDRWLADVDGQ